MDKTDIFDISLIFDYITCLYGIQKKKMKFKRLVELMFYISCIMGLIIIFLTTTFSFAFSEKGLFILEKIFYVVLGFFISSSIIFYRVKLKIA